MAVQVSEFNRGENKARSLIVGALSATLLLAALFPQNTRAVFITDGGLPGAKAFTATLGTTGPGQRSSYLSGIAAPRGPLDRRSATTPAAYGPARRADTPAVAFTRGVPPTAPVGTGPVEVAANTVSPPGRDALVDAGLGTPASGTAQPFTPAISQPVAGASGFSGANPGTGTPGTTTPGTTTPGTTTPGTTTPGTPTPVSAVPEPSTWAMLLGGFLMVGCALRLRRRGVRGFGESVGEA
ncbi:MULTISPECIES: PEPxxWA-CTERM sorting domain-containing protein [unclassified Sphingomonas]|uniref:PEPxxWA-CTERM sorting domain-containing protein n=1 Tax=unclassified Sphingomonas TaxID=196159 RepID=UPI001F58EB5B|nr:MULTISPECIES: PEPxxWA-CTERM sorting domain-containing protein [unclassified Sphingomonas]